MESDRRNKQVLLTDSGRAYADEILTPLWEIEQKAVTVLSDKERDTLLDMLERCYMGYKSAAEIK